MNRGNPFLFYTERRLVRLTGLRARTLGQLLAQLREVPGSAVFYHTHHMYLAHHFETPAFSNDFALWTGEALQMRALAEKLAAVDLLSFTSIRDLRDAIAATMERHAAETGAAARECPPGDEFHFCRSKSFIMPTGLVARTPRELFELMARVSNVSLFFHLFEARLRLGRPSNDFSRWLEGRGEPALAKAIEEMDPYAVTLDELRDKIVALYPGAGKGASA